MHEQISHLPQSVIADTPPTLLRNSVSISSRFAPLAPPLLAEDEERMMIRWGENGGDNEEENGKMVGRNDGKNGKIRARMTKVRRGMAKSG